MVTIRQIPLKGKAQLILTVIWVIVAQLTMAQVQIQDVTSTVSTCPNNGSISVTATGSNPPLIYSIINGPVTQPDQTSATFNSLPPGNYTVQVTDVSGNEATEDVTITGTYQVLDFSLYPSSPICPGGNDGGITGFLSTGTGKSPFTWELTEPVAYATGPQTSSVFNNLPAGDYTIKVTDNCGAFRTRTTKITAPDNSISLNKPPFATIVGCDSALIEIDLRVPNYSPPYNVIIGSNTSTINVLKENVINVNHLNLIKLTQLVEGLTYGDNVNIEVTDNCNRSVSYEANLREFTFCSSFIPRLENCKYLDESFTNNSAFKCPGTNVMSTYFAPPLNFELRDGTDGSVIETGAVLNKEESWMDGINGVYPDSIKEGKSYEITITDKCGKTYTDTYTAPVLSDPSKSPDAEIVSLRESECLDSLANITITASYFKSSPRVIITSGPSQIGSTKEDFEYSYSISYPDTTDYSLAGNDISRDYYINNLGVGSYTYKVEDDCGNEVTGSFEIKPEDVGTLEHSHNVFTYKPGCLGNNQINYMITHDGEVRIQNSSTGFNWSKDYFFLTGDTIRDSVQNLVPGTYDVLLRRGTSGGRTINDLNIGCYQYQKKITIEDGVAPEINTYNAVICGSSIIAELFPDSSKGVPPYEYEIISGPQTFPRQAENVFTLSNPGVYNTRIYDACGNGSTREISIEDIEFEPLSANITCNEVRVLYPTSKYYTHVWRRPDNSEFTGDSLILNTITPADTGTYYVTQTVEISGCTETFESSHHIKLADSYKIEDSICQGATYMLGSQTITSAGIYHDTLTTALGCDSIIELDLKIRKYLTGTVSHEICPGGSISIAGKNYFNEGIYYDTLTTATCDSILTIDISFGDYLTGMLDTTICPGENVTIAGKIYNTAGPHTDTLYTGSCDSILTINITQLDYLRSSLDSSFCKGKDITINGIVYDAPGTFTDTISTETCDSVVTLTLTENDFKRGFEEIWLCPGKDTLIRGESYGLPGVYYDTLATASCDSIIEFQIFQAPTPFVDLGPDTSLCQGESLLLKAGDGFSKYYWDDDFTNSTSQTLSVNSIGEHWVEVRNNYGCKASDTIQILNVFPLPIVSVEKDTTICLGDTVELKASGGYSYSWEPGSASQETIEVAPSRSTIYTVKAVDANNCLSASKEVTVSIKYPSVRPVFDKGHITHCFAESPAEINAEWGEAFYWSFSGETTKGITVTQEGIYEVEVSDINGCSVTGKIFVEDKCEAMVFVPEAFSPNYDGLHDKLEIFGKNFTNFEMRIFNRWGEIIFLTNKPEEMWDGSYRGKPMPVGSYPYVIQYTPLFVSKDSPGGTVKRLTGSVTIVR